MIPRINFDLGNHAAGQEPVMAKWSPEGVVLAFIAHAI